MPVIGRVGRPGLLGMAARTAVVAGTAQAVSGRVAARQQQRMVERSAPPPPPPAPAAVAAPADPLVEQLRQLAQLHADGVLDDAEFATAKRRLVGS